MFKHAKGPVELLNVASIPLGTNEEPEQYHSAVIRFKCGLIRTCELTELVLDFTECVSLLDWVRSDEWVNGVSFADWNKK